MPGGTLLSQAMTHKMSTDLGSLRDVRFHHNRFFVFDMLSKTLFTLRLCNIITTKTLLCDAFVLIMLINVPLCYRKQASIGQ